VKFLFIHQNFPGQFAHLAPALAADPRHEVVALRIQREGGLVWKGVRIVTYHPSRGSTPRIHPWVIDLETKVIRAEAAFHAFQQLRREGFVPDAVIAHPGWGESMFVKEVWPGTRLGIYCEFFYRSSGADTGFDPEFPDGGESEPCRVRLKNLNNLLHFDRADAGICPTQWQASTFPDAFRDRITVVHDGIDSGRVAPHPAAAFEGGTPVGPVRFSRDDEVITFVNRNLEPYRGYHQFMRALPAILARRPRAHVVLVGGSDVSYGPRPAAGRTWKDLFLDEVRDRIDLRRVHFVGQIPYPAFLSLLQVSTVHVYLTYPFVLSWSLLEAMSAGCAIVASDTAPVREAIVPGQTGRLVDFFDPARLAEETVALLDNADERARLGRNAREFAVARYDLRSVCLPRQLAWVRSLAGDASASPAAPPASD
jgi:glycosyltransferase involved in cell wall biosynthesis